MKFEKNLIKLNQSFDSKEEAIRYCGRQLFEAGHVNESYIDAMIQRDRELSVYMGNFIAIPHGTDSAKNEVKSSGITIVQVPSGVNEHLEIIQKISIFCADVDNVVKIADAQSVEQIIQLLSSVE